MLKMRMKSLLFVMSMLAVRSMEASTTATLSEAMQFFEQHQLAKAGAVFEEIATMAPKPEDRAQAERWLARFDWWFYGKPEMARHRLLEGSQHGVNTSELLIELSMLEAHEGNFSEARTAALRALLFAKHNEQMRDAKVRFASAVVEEAARARLKSEALPDKNILADAHSTLRRIVEDEPGLLEPSRLLLTASLLREDGDGALFAFRSYYRIASDPDAYSPLRQPLKNLELVLPGWKGQKLPADQAIAIVHALADSRFFAEAAIVARNPDLEDSVRHACADILSYADFLQYVESSTNEYYRLTALGKASIATWLRGILHELLSRWMTLGISGEIPTVGDLSALDETALEKILDQISPIVLESLGKHYGAYFNFGTTAGYFDLHMGHVVDDEKQVIEQYGRRAVIHLTVLDMMTSNGFQSWAWCYESQHGGWATEDTIYQIRPSMADSPLDMWQALTDPAKREHSEKFIQTESAEDEMRATQNPYVYLPGMATRLKLQALENLRSQLRQRGLEGSALRTAFLAAIEQDDRNATILAHEGRHVIDMQAGIKDPTELEFGAKLSQIAFALLPREQLLSVIDPVLGDPTPHGQADLQIVKGLVGWMQKQAAEIKGLTPGHPLLPQLDLLTDDQIREAIRSLDPFAALHPVPHL